MSNGGSVGRKPKRGFALAALGSKHSRALAFICGSISGVFSGLQSGFSSSSDNLKFTLAVPNSGSWLKGWRK
jgi:hypothetical protein